MAPDWCADILVGIYFDWKPLGKAAHRVRISVKSCAICISRLFSIDLRFKVWYLNVLYSTESTAIDLGV